MNGASSQRALLFGGAITSIGTAVWFKGKDERVLTTAECTNARKRLQRLCTLDPDQTRVATDQHLSNLKKYGVSVVKETLDGHERDQWKNSTISHRTKNQNKSKARIKISPYSPSHRRTTRRRTAHRHAEESETLFLCVTRRCRANAEGRVEERDRVTRRTVGR